MSLTAFLLALYCCFGAATAAPAMTRPVHLRPMTVVVLPDSATTLFAKHSARLTPAGRAWVASESQRLRSGVLDPTKVEGEAGRFCAPAFGSCGGEDIEALTVLVLMQAASDADQDLRDMISEMEANSRAKSHMRAAIRTMRSAKALTAQQLRQRYCEMRDKTNSMSEVSEEDSLRLQTAMDRASKMMSTLSNVLKKTSDVQQSVIQKMK
jgi:hypothetical protein